MQNLDPLQKAEIMQSRLQLLDELSGSCRLCPRLCGINRSLGEMGVCRTGTEPVFSSVNLHFGEEPPISGRAGSGTVFMTGCNLQCKFCQNYPISQLRHGNETTVDKLADSLMKLQVSGAHNINFVTPTHQAAAIYKVLLSAFRKGLCIPIVYNSGGYESVEMLKLWEDIIDIYMPDSKYGSDESALRYSNAPEYVRHNRAALKEMHRQVGELEVDSDGIAVKGLLVRHLVLPGGLAGTGDVLRFIAEEISTETYLSLMNQYFPAWKAMDYPELNHVVSRGEYKTAVTVMRSLGMENGWIQSKGG